LNPGRSSERQAHTTARDQVQYPGPLTNNSANIKHSFINIQYKGKVYILITVFLWSYELLVSF